MGSCNNDNFLCDVMGQLRLITDLLAGTGGGGAGGSVQLLCDPSNGNRVIVRHVFNSDGTVASVGAYSLNGAAYVGSITALVACEDTETYTHEYPICDNGVQKLVRICWNGCAPSTVQYFTLAREASTSPLDFNLVTYGSCTADSEVDTYEVVLGCVTLADNSSFPVDIVKTISPAGLVTDVAYYLADGTLVTLIEGDTVVAGPCLAKARNGTVSRQTVNVAGAIPPGKASVSIVNVGSVAGVAMGNQILPGEGFTFTAYLDNNTLEFIRLPSITYDGTGTVLRLTIQD